MGPSAIFEGIKTLAQIPNLLIKDGSGERDNHNPGRNCLSVVLNRKSSLNVFSIFSPVTELEHLSCC